MGIETALVSSLLGSLVSSALKSNTFKNLMDQFKEETLFIEAGDQVDRIRQAYHSERLVLVLGSGISSDFGMPTWGALLQKLILSGFLKDTEYSEEQSMALAEVINELFAPNPVIAARHLRNMYKNDVLFEESIRNALYEKIDYNANSELTNEIIKLCLAPGKNPNLDSVITYNYDDIIETKLEDLGLDVLFKPVYTVGDLPKQDELAIYHVHGYLPKDKSRAKENRITFSEDVYHQQYSEIYSWNNMVQINKFREKVCLFIGLSLSDPNIRRLLDIAKDQRGDRSPVHFIFRQRFDRDKIQKDLETAMPNKNKKDQNQSGEQDALKETATFLATTMERFITNDDLSFGVNTIWVDTFSEIPVLLRELRGNDQ